MTNFDLTTLNLADGTHRITVIAKASGYKDSKPSNAVSYVVGRINTLTITPKDADETGKITFLPSEIVLTNSNRTATFEVMVEDDWNIKNYEFNAPITIIQNESIFTVSLTEDLTTVMSIDIDFYLEQSEPETLSPGLYDVNDTLLASWDSLVNTYGLDCSKDYKAMEFPAPTTTLRSIVNKNTELSNAVKLVIGDNISRIGNYAFNYCSFLTSIAFSNSVISIGSSVFANCSNLKRLDFSTHTSIPTLEGRIIGTGAGLQIKVPANLIDDWKGATNWSEKADSIVTEFTNEV